MNIAQLNKEAEAAIKRGGEVARWAKAVRHLIARVVKLEAELQASRQLSLFGDVPPARKTPIGT